MVYPSDHPLTTDDKALFFKIDDVWDFDNIAVSKPTADLAKPTVADSSFSILRLLICSECDRGPLGFAGHLNGDSDVGKLVYFLSCESVLYDTT